MMMVPSAWEAKKRVDDPGTHRTAVHGEPEIDPFRRTIVSRFKLPVSYRCVWGP